MIHIIDANIGMTESDVDMLHRFTERAKDVIIVANKIDKIKKADYEKQMQNIQDKAERYMVIPCSVKKNTGVGVLMNEILKACQ